MSMIRLEKWIFSHWSKWILGFWCVGYFLVDGIVDDWSVGKDLKGSSCDLIKVLSWLGHEGLEMTLIASQLRFKPETFQYKSTALCQDSVVEIAAILALCQDQSVWWFWWENSFCGRDSCHLEVYGQLWEYWHKTVKLIVWYFVMGYWPTKTPWPESASELYRPSDRRTCRRS
jgi:hypothetical protein